MILDHLVNSILSVNTALRDTAAKAINKCEIWQPAVAKFNGSENKRRIVALYVVKN